MIRLISKFCTAAKQSNLYLPLILMIIASNCQHFTLSLNLIYTLNKSTIQGFCSFEIIGAKFMFPSKIIFKKTKHIKLVFK